MEYGGEIELRNVEGLTPMDILKGNGDARDCIAYLENVIGLLPEENSFNNVSLLFF